jgi:hypothetical protein
VVSVSGPHIEAAAMKRVSAGFAGYMAVIRRIHGAIKEVTVLLPNRTLWDEDSRAHLLPAVARIGEGRACRRRFAQTFKTALAALT